MDPVAIGIFVICGLLVLGAIALRRPKAKPVEPKAEPGADAPTDIDLKIPESDNTDVDRELE
jgi:hypothetical protein